jgi:hypothetical protein
VSREIQVRKAIESDSRAAMTVATLVTREWSEGYSAGRRGLVASENPHPIGSVAATEWLAGLAAGQARGRLRVLSGGRCD